MGPHESFDHPTAGHVVRDPARLAVCWSRGAPERRRAALLKRLGLKRLDTVEPERPFAQLPINNTEVLWWVQEVNGRKLSEDAISAIERSPDVEWVADVYRAETAPDDPATRFCVNPSRLYVKEAAAGLVTATAEGRASLAVDSGRTRQLRGLVALNVQGVSRAEGRTAVDVFLRLIEERPEARADVKLENIPLVSPATRVVCAPSTTHFAPNDPLFPTQWNLERVNAPRAWPITRGSPEVVIAVIDQGVELAHPDLSLHPLSWNASTDMPDGSPVGNHGTPCAGIAAARMHNGAGVAGLAGESLVMAIATSTWADIDIVEGLYFAADNGAHVVSMSFGVYPWWGVWDFDLIEDALQYAYDKGLVLVAASGNENGPDARFPGSDARTICVGGSNRDDLRKSVGDASSEAWWGASYGPSLDVVAPCLEIPATDRLGANGYNPGDYMPNFNGTSSATPLVAGLAALILSVDPGVANESVREIIETTCDKVNPATYTYAVVGSKPNGTWNDEMGYGRINAERALLATCSRVERPASDLCDCCRRPQLPGVPHECSSPPAPPWTECDRCLYFYENRFLQEGVLQLRIVYEHCLKLLGRQQGPLLYTTTLLPGEELRLFTFDRYRRVRAEEQRVSLYASFRQTVGALWEARTTRSERDYQKFSGRVRSEGDSSISVGGMLFPVTWDIEDPDLDVSLLVGSDVRTANSEFEQVVRTASQQVEAERSLVVSTYEEQEHRETTARTLRNQNHCHAVTYFVRQVYECFELRTSVFQVQWRAARDRARRAWRPIDELPDEDKKQYREFLDRAPKVGDAATEDRTISLATDGMLWEAELAHCSSCDPLRTEEVHTELDRARHEARRICVAADLMAVEVERRRLLLRKGELAPFGGAPTVQSDGVEPV